MLTAIAAIETTNEDLQKLRDREYEYFRKNMRRMRYDVFRNCGLFVGSGVIEAGCKTVIGRRLKNAGMHWTEEAANNIIALRCTKASGRWEDFWEWQKAA